MDVHAVIGESEERFVLDDGTIDFAAELVANVFRFGATVAVREEVGSVEIGVAVEFVHGAVEIVGSRFLHRADQSASGVAVFGAHIVGEHGEFSDGFEWRRDVVAAFAEVVVVIGTIQHVGGAGFARTTRGGLQVHALRDAGRRKGQSKTLRVSSGMLSIVLVSTVVDRSELAV